MSGQPCGQEEGLPLLLGQDSAQWPGTGSMRQGGTAGPGKATLSGRGSWAQEA